MMRLLRVRIPAAFLAALYLAFPGGLLGVRPCAHHDGLVAEAVAEHDAHHAQDAGHGAPASEADSEAHEGCSCLNACAAGSAIALDAVAPVVPAAATSSTNSETLAASGPRAIRPPHFLPFQTAPPSVPV